MLQGDPAPSRQAPAAAPPAAAARHALPPPAGARPALAAHPSATRRVRPGPIPTAGASTPIVELDAQRAAPQLSSDGQGVWTDLSGNGNDVDLFNAGVCVGGGWGWGGSTAPGWRTAWQARQGLVVVG